MFQFTKTTFFSVFIHVSWCISVTFPLTFSPSLFLSLPISRTVCLSLFLSLSLSSLSLFISHLSFSFHASWCISVTFPSLFFCYSFCICLSLIYFFLSLFSAFSYMPRRLMHISYLPHLTLCFSVSLSFGLSVCHSFCLCITLSISHVRVFTHAPWCKKQVYLGLGRVQLKIKKTVSQTWIELSATDFCEFADKQSQRKKDLFFILKPLAVI